MIFRQLLNIPGTEKGDIYLRTWHIWFKSCRTGKKCSECPNLTLSPRVALSKPSILQTWVFYPVGNLWLEHPHKNCPLPGTPGNMCRKLLKFPETPGNFNWWNCNIILMTIDKVYLVAIRATVILTFIPVMVRGLYDTFPESFPGYIGPFPHFLDLCWRKYWYLTLDWSRKPYNMPRKCLRRPRKCVKESTSHHWVSHGIYVNVTVALRETRYASFIDIRIILQFHQFRFPGVSGNFNPFLHTFPGIPGRWKFLCRCARYRYPAG